MAQEWQHLKVRIDRTLNNSQLVLTPSQPDLETNLLELGDINQLNLLDELGSKGWELVAVRDGEFWLKRPVLLPMPEQFAPTRLR